MSRRRIVFALGAVLALAVLFAGSAAITRSLRPAPSPPKGVTGELSQARLYAVLPRSVEGGKLHRQGPAPELDSLEISGCVAGHGSGRDPADGPVGSAVEQPVAGTYYQEGDYALFVQVFRFRTSELRQVKQLLDSAPASCVRASPQEPALPYNKLGLSFGDASAVYRGARDVGIMMASKSWGLSIRTASITEERQDPFAAAKLATQAIPDLLQQLDQELPASFWPPKGTLSALTSPSSTPYLADGRAGGVSPLYRPSSVVLQSSLTIGALRWSSWNRQEASGTGSAAYDTCDPDCADGRTERFPAHVTLDTPRYMCGYIFYTRVKVHAPTAPLSGPAPRDSTTSVAPFCGT